MKWNRYVPKHFENAMNKAQKKTLRESDEAFFYHLQTAITPFAETNIKALPEILNP